MNQRYMILCVDDEREVLDSVVQDLDIFEEHFIIEAAQSVAEAKEVIAEYQHKHIELAAILCDHIMPEQTGISFLIELNDDPATQQTRKILLTGQAGLDDTVEAINHACLDFYLSKPWKANELKDLVKHQLTLYVVHHEKDLAPWLKVLDANILLQKMAEQRTQFGE